MRWQPLTRSSPYVDGVRQPDSTLGPDTTMWANPLYIVHRRVMRPPAPKEVDAEVAPDALHLSIRNQDHSARHDWRDFQRIKNQLAGPEWEAIEFYPAESRLIDTANQFHLFAFPFIFEGIGFNEGRVVARHAQSSGLSPGSVQRDPEPVDGPVSSMSTLRRYLENHPGKKETP